MSVRSSDPASAAPTPRPASALPFAARAWRDNPWAAWLAAGLAALLLIARKPWALGTPQLWAEDGPIHLAQNDAWGAGALFAPYRGYLHLLPRLIAWGASRLADVAYWPFLYNLAAFLIAAAVFARLASRRIDLPAKPWLVLSLVLAAHTGEVWLNITNLHWVTSFLLVAQVLIARPVTPAQRGVDLVILAVIGLTGPFVLVFLPLFAWRWWRERHADNLAVLLVAAACAGLQLHHIMTARLQLGPQAHPLHLELLLATIGSRLVVWPLLGVRAASSLPWPALGAIGLTFILALLAWSLRPAPRRRQRAPVAAAFLLITVVCVWRIRPDTWDYPDLVNGDSYFYIGRILLLWLLIWECDARPRAVAYAARALCLAALLTQAVSFTLPAPPDYHWSEHCHAIRRGEPAKIPTLPEGHIFDYPGRPAGAPRPVPWIKASAEAIPGRIVNASVLTRLTAEEPSFTVGAVIGGDRAKGAAPLLLRAVGPSLAPLGIRDVLPDPRLSVRQGGQVIAANDNWADAGAGELSAAFARAGAFRFLARDSRDAAVAFNAEVNSTTSLTIEVSGGGAAGMVLAEIYDAAASDPPARGRARLINFSVLKQMAPQETLTVGFVLGGGAARRVLLRAVGPTLRAAFGVDAALPDPSLAVYDHAQSRLGANNDWGGNSRLVAAFSQVGAFRLPPESRDAAVLLTLKPGSYSAHVSGAATTSGTVLVEVYEVP